MIRWSIVGIGIMVFLKEYTRAITCKMERSLPFDVLNVTRRRACARKELD
jgi:hypothetical protein